MLMACLAILEMQEKGDHLVLQEIRDFLENQVMFTLKLFDYGLHRGVDRIIYTGV